MKKLLYWLWRVLPMPEWLRNRLMWLINRKFVIGTAVLILNEQGEILLFKHAYRPDTPWGFPGGYVKKGEDPLTAIIRETREESGLDVRVVKLLDVIHSKDAPRQEVLFLGELVEGAAFRPSIEVSEARFFPLDELPELLPEHMGMIERYILSE